MFSFKPKSEKEALNLLDPGEYSFIVDYAEATTSKSGNPMIKVILFVLDKSGYEKQINDYLMEEMAYKLRHFFYSIGMGNQYEIGQIEPSKLLGKKGVAKIKIAEAKDNFPPKNVVSDYLVKEPAKEDVDDKPFEDDASLPFWYFRSGCVTIKINVPECQRENFRVKLIHKLNMFSKNLKETKEPISLTVRSNTCEKFQRSLRKK